MALAASALALAACASDSQVRADPANAYELAGYVEQAQQGGASDAQVAALEAALASSELTFEDFATLVAATVECDIDGGLDAFPLEPREVVPGLLEPVYGFRIGSGLSEDEGHAVDIQCFMVNMGYAQMFYERQPSSLERQAADFQSKRVAIVQCLADHGTALDAAATGAEILAAVDEDWDQNSQEPGFEPCYMGSVSDAP